MVVVVVAVVEIPLANLMTLLSVHINAHVGGCQNYGPFLGPYHNTAPNI